MRQKNHTRPAYFILPGLLVTLAAAFIITSCQKTSTVAAEPPAKDEMQLATDLLKGKLIWGNLENSGSEDNTIYLDFNKGDRAIFVQLSPDNTGVEIPSLEKAGVITSQHGIIIKDPSNNKVFLFPQNDTESMRKFESIASLFKEKAGNIPIAGTVLLNFKS